MKISDWMPSQYFIKAIALLGYFVIPAVVYFSLGTRWGETIPLDKFSLGMFIPNYLVFAAQHILWAITSLLLRPSSPVLHGGYLGATFTLLSLQPWFKCCVDNSNAMGWLYYWPLAIIAIIVCAGIGAHVNEQKSKRVS